ncbi:MAG: L-histidine N(alpha)-methyltransferase [Candidatus Kapaibacterium sp.]
MHTTTNYAIELFDRSRNSDEKIELAENVQLGFQKRPKELSPKFFYDQRGSQLFEKITTLPEYYQTRTERKLLQQIAPRLAEEKFVELIELGSGSSSKTRVLLDAMTMSGELQHYIPIDVSGDFLLSTAARLGNDYPTLQIKPVAGDFLDGLHGIERTGSALVIFLGGTIGNLYRSEGVAFLTTVAEDMADGDLFMMGVDLVKDPNQLHAAYNDSEGVTAEFNKNLLHVINRELDATFNPDEFYHYAFYNPDDTRIEMRLVSRSNQEVNIGKLEMQVEFEEGESILTEISRKFTRASVGSMLNDAGMELIEWWSDDDELFGLIVARKERSGL